MYDFEEGDVLNLLKSVDLSVYPLDSTLILSMLVKSKLAGHFFQPYVEIVGEKSEKIYFEHGLNGKRYLDLSGFTRQTNIRFRFHHCKLLKTEAILHRFHNPDLTNKKILVLASHPDDAEIAAYGVYSSTKESYIITVTVGEGNSRLS